MDVLNDLAWKTVSVLSSENNVGRKPTYNGGKSIFTFITAEIILMNILPADNYDLYK